ncbi:MAG: hypothetical protein ACE5I3_06700 [Phycisphaerae bacterium]
MPLGGQPPFTYRWSAHNPAGEPVNELLDSTADSAVRFTAGEVDGPYDVHCTVSDARGREYTASLVLQVGGAIGLEITTERLGVIAGGGAFGQTTVHLNPRFGTPPFDARWVCSGPDGNVDNDRLDTTDPLAPRFTSGDQVGRYVLTATVVDANDETAVESVVVVVGQIRGLEVIASRASVLPGGGADGIVTLLATPIGGRGPYEYDWEVIGPDGRSRNGLLWDTAVRSPIFESGDGAGTFLARCAATDATGAVLIGSTTIVVGQRISTKVSADRLALPVAGTDAAQATLTADVRGGRDPVSIQWHVITPGGEDAAALLSTTSRPETIFTPGDQAGSYVVRCTATDADVVSSTDSLVLRVGGTLGLVVVAEKTALAAGGGVPTGTTPLRAQAYGGTPPYSYDWSVVDPSGAPEPGRLEHTTTANPTFTSASQVGSYSVFCTVTDAADTCTADAVDIHVSQPLNGDVAVDKQALIAGGGVGGQAQLITTVNGGSEPYIYQWSVTGPNNASDLSRLSDTQAANPVFTSALVTGTYRLTLTTTDALGAVFVDLAEVVVGSTDESAPGQNLSADVSIDRLPVPPFGETALLTVTTVGGVEPIGYAWTVTDPDGATDNERLNSTSTPTVTFTSSATQGTYRVRCTVSDAAGNRFTDSVQLTVTDSFSLDVAAAVTQVPPGGTVNLFADRTGGAANFTYAWSCVDDTGTPVGSFATGATGSGAAKQIAADDVTNAWTAPPAGSGSSGTYRVQVTLTDALGNMATDTASIVVQSPLSLNVTADNTFVAPTAVVTLLADQSGGETPYTYTWLAEDNTGANAGTFTTGAGGIGTATQTDEAGDASNGWSVASEGVYTITCTVMDHAGQTFTDSVPVIVTTQQAFWLDVTVDKVVVGPGEVINLVADQTGGIPDFDYAWSALNEAGAAAGTFGAANQNGVAGDTANTWTAPSAAGAEGTYRIRCTVTDAQGRTSTATVMVEVGTLILQNTFLAPAAADTTSVLGATAIELAAEVGGAGQEITVGLNDLPDPRNLVVHIVDTNDGILTGTARVTGLDARGTPQVEIIPLTGSGFQYASGTGVAPFAAVTKIELYDLTEVTIWPPGNIDEVSVGVGDKFGLTNLLNAANDVLYTREGGSVITSGFTVDIGDGQQGITFSTAPDGVRDYIVVFRAR